MWEETNLKEVIQVNPKVKLIKSESYPFIEIENIKPPNKFVESKVSKNYSGQSSSKFINNDVVFSRITPCLENRKIAQVVLTDKECGFGSTEFYVFRNIEGKSVKKFIFYFVSSDLVVLPAINSMTGASGRQRADRKFIENLKVSFPPLSTQQNIASILSDYDDLIENNNRRIELLEQAAQQIYKEWFVRFRFQGYKTTQFTKGIPDGWEVNSITELADITDGTHDTPKPIDKGYYLVTGKHIINDTIDFSQAYFISEEDHISISKRSGLRKGNILFSNIGTIGSTCIIGENTDFSVKNVIIVKPFDNEGTCYLYCLLKNITTQEVFKQQASGSSQQFIALGFMRKYKILIPDRKLLKKFSLLVEPILNEKAILEIKNQNLIKQRDLLLPRLMSGKIEL